MRRRSARRPQPSRTKDLQAILALDVLESRVPVSEQIGALGALGILAGVSAAGVEAAPPVSPVSDSSRWAAAEASPVEQLTLVQASPPPLAAGPAEPVPPSAPGGGTFQVDPFQPAADPLTLPDFPVLAGSHPASRPGAPGLLGTANPNLGGGQPSAAPDGGLARTAADFAVPLPPTSAPPVATIPFLPPAAGSSTVSPSAAALQGQVTPVAGIGGVGSGSGSQGNGDIEPLVSSGPLWVVDANKAIVLNPNVTAQDFSSYSVTLLAQVSGATVQSYSWSTSGNDFTNVSALNTFKLTFTWATFTSGPHSDSVTITMTPTVGNAVTQTYNFSVIGTGSPAWPSALPSSSSWPYVETPDAIMTDQATVDAQYYSLALDSGALLVNHALPAYNPGVAPLELMYDSTIADRQPIFVVHFQIDPNNPNGEPPSVTAQLTLNGQAGSAITYTTTSLNPGDIMQIALQATNATTLNTGRYPYSVSITANYSGNPVTTVYSGNVDLINPNTNSSTNFLGLGDGWTLGNMERLWSVSGMNGGAIVEEPGGLSLWFAQNGSTFTSPAGDFSTLTQSGNTFQRTMVDGSKINFTQSPINSSFYQETSTVDRNNNTTTFTYDTNSSDPNYGALVKITDFDNQVTTLSYNGSGFVSTITDAALRTTALAYDASGRLTSITDPAPGGGATTPVFAFGYDTDDRITSLTDPRSNVTSFSYSSGRVATVTRPDQVGGSNVTVTLAPYQLQGLGSPSSPVLAAQAQAQLTDGRGNTWLSQFDALGFGRITQAQDPRTDVTAMTVDFRNTNGLVYLATDPLGRHTGYQYDSKGRTTQIGWADDTSKDQYTYADSMSNPNFDQPSTHVDATTQTTTYSYDGNGNLVTIKQPPVTNPDDNNHQDSPVTTITYWPASGGRPGGLVQSIEDPLQHTTSFGYQTTTPQDLLVVVTYPYETALMASPFVTMAYDSAGNLASETDERGYVTSWTYDALDRPITKQLPVNSGPAALYTFGYDATSNLTKLITPLPTTWTWSYDVLNRQVGATDPLSHTVSTTYDAASNVSQVEDALTHTTSYTYNPANDEVAMSDPLGHTTSYGFDAAGEPISVENALTNVTSYSYDKRGRLTAITTPAGDQTTFAYDGAGDTTAATEYDLGHGGNPSQSFTWNMAYDALHRETLYTDADSNSTSFIYDLAGNLRTANGPAPGDFGPGLPPAAGTGGCGCGEKNFTYNAQNDLTSLSDSMNPANTTSFGYDAAQNQTEIQDPSGNITTVAYDAQNRVSSVTNPPITAGTGVITYAYDVAGRLASVKDPNLNTTNYYYDNANRQTAVQDPAGLTTVYAYDAANRLTGITDRNGHARTFGYDAANRLISEGWTGSSPSYSASYGYDVANRMTSASDSNSGYTFGYDSSDRETSAAQAATLFTPSVRLTYGYDGLDNRISLADNITTGDLITYSYDGDHHLKGATWEVGGTNQAQMTLAYDSRNRLIHLDRTATSGGAVDVSTTIGYNADDHVTTITNYAAGVASLVSFSYGYDANSRVSNSTGPEGSRSYGYDATNQLTVVNGANPHTVGYDLNGNRKSFDGTSLTTGTDNRLTFDGTYTYQYDTEGEVTARIGTNDVTTYTWDFRHELIEANRTLNSTTSDEKYTYDVFGRRIGVTVNGTAQQGTVYDGANAYADFLPNGATYVLTARYLYGTAIDQLFARYTTGGGVNWYLTDNLGSVRQIVDATGASLYTVNYDSFGNQVGGGGSGGDRFTFAGREWDNAIGQYFDRARYYSPGTGRFINEDPLGLAAGDTNLYRYVNNDPSNSTDPSGLQQYRYQTQCPPSMPGAPITSPGPIPQQPLPPVPRPAPTQVVAPDGTTINLQPGQQVRFPQGGSIKINGQPYWVPPGSAVLSNGAITVPANQPADPIGPDGKPLTQTGLIPSNTGTCPPGSPSTPVTTVEPYPRTGPFAPGTPVPPYTGPQLKGGPPSVGISTGPRPTPTPRPGVAEIRGPATGPSGPRPGVAEIRGPATGPSRPAVPPSPPAPRPRGR